MGGGSLGDGEKLLDRGLAPAALEALIAFPQSFGDNMGHGLPRRLGNRLGETVSLRVFDIQSHGSSSSFL
jgi:hypothetical protein